ncbi:putative transcription factor homeobox-WOX family [Helianthus annuus]|nr:putative transcription factor homeobox-WOX family [Helianthus annuus]
MLSLDLQKEEMESMMRPGKEEMESGSGSDQIEGGLSGNEVETDQQHQPTKKKRYHRHTAHQIQQMEALFKESPHPDDKRRLKLSQELGLKPRQVKFWFQNRRTQMKVRTLACIHCSTLVGYTIVHVYITLAKPKI